MSHFTLITSGLRVTPLLAEIDAHPEIWDRHPERRAGGSPHRETSDVWVRYMDPVLMPRHDFTKPHQSVWYPASDVIPSLSLLLVDLRKVLVGSIADDLGGILITRIPAGKQVYPHHDRGTWHSEHYDLKVWIPLRANDRCVNHVEGEEMVWSPGEAWHHDNLIEHGVVNGGGTERICLIVCFRRK